MHPISTKTNLDPFPIPQVYPLPNKIEKYMIPADHPWLEIIETTLRNLTFYKGVSRVLEEEFSLLSESDSEVVLTKPNWPFVLKVSAKNSQNQIPQRRVLLQHRMNEFIEKANLDCLQQYQKFLLAPNIVIAEKLKKGSLNVWHALDKEAQQKRKMQAATAIVELGYGDAHRDNIVLLENAKMAFWDFDEGCGHTSVFSQLLHFSNDDEGRIREKEIAISEMGLENFLKHPNLCFMYSQETHAKLLSLFKKKLAEEKKTIQIHRKCKQILKQYGLQAKLSASPLAHQNQRILNLQKRSFSILQKYRQ